MPIKHDPIRHINYVIRKKVASGQEKNQVESASGYDDLVLSHLNE